MIFNFILTFLKDISRNEKAKTLILGVKKYTKLIYKTYKTHTDLL